MSIRDACSDTGRMGSAAHNRADFATGMDFGPTTLAEQAALGGMNKTDLPEGGPPVPGQIIIGTRN